MYEFMDYIQNAFHDTSIWNRDNFYSTLTATAHGLLDFRIPRGVHLHVSSLASPNLATSYTLNNTGLVDGSFSYLYSSIPLHIPHRSNLIPLRSLVRGYRHLVALRPPDEPWWWETWHGGKRVDSRDTLMFGRVFLPAGSLEAMYLRRISPTRLLSVKAVSDNSLPSGGTILALVANDHGKYSTEYLYSTDSALLGFRGLYNFGADPREQRRSFSASTKTALADVPLTASALLELPPPSLLSLGGEVYYGAQSKSFGVSTGVRFTTLTPSHTGFPYTMTLTLNPLMGNLSSTYSVKAGNNLALSSRFDFNFYSYESGVRVGCELWRKRMPVIPPSNSQEDKPSDNFSGADKSHLGVDDDIAGVLKARIDQDWRVGLSWEGRFKELLFSVGASLDFRRREHIFGGLGVEMSYSS